MFEDITDALADLDVQPGQTRLVQVKDYELEIRRRVEPPEPPSEFADMVMLEPWTEFPSEGKPIKAKVRFGKLPLPDPPDIPVDFEEHES